MTEFTVAFVGVALFAISFGKIRIAQEARKALDVSRNGVAALTDTTLDDDSKERAVQKAGLRLLILVASVALRLCVVVAITAAPFLLAHYFGLASLQDAAAVLVRWDFILASSLAVICAIWIASRIKASSEIRTEKAGPYSGADEIMHMIAFHPPVQRLAMRCDNFVFERRHSKRRNRRVVFLTSIARGGTTACLNALYSLDRVSTNTYRDMPLVTAPYIWNKVSRLLRRKTVRMERAHGDGLEIDLDSPEAFDEVYWKLLWPEKYRDNGIALWTRNDLEPRLIDQLALAFEKTSVVRGPQCDTYLSKNNANLARIDLIGAAFPEAHIVVPIRRPAAHAASLLRQQINFVRLQSASGFVRKYMQDIGHFEFGLSHRPLRFPGFDPTRYRTDEPDYWLSYWISAFEYVRERASRVCLITQDDLRQDPDSALAALISTIGLECGDSVDFTGYFRREPDLADCGVFSSFLLARANEIYDDLAAERLRLPNTRTLLSSDQTVLPA